MDTELYSRAFGSAPNLVRVGALHLPSGALIAGDPFFCANAIPFGRTVTPGDYEVQLHIVRSAEWGQRVSLARVLLFPNADVASLVPATIGKMGANVYCVDSGLGSFMDEEARSRFANEMADFYRAHPGGNYYTDVLMAEFIQVARSSQNPANISPWNLHSLPGSTLNVAMFASGLGDGCFESFWAISPDGDVTALVTDFGLL